jgi:hypothetical protein
MLYICFLWFHFYFLAYSLWLLVYGASLSIMCHGPLLQTYCVFLLFSFFILLILSIIIPPWVKWDRVCKSKEKGLGIRNLKLFNTTLLGNWWCSNLKLLIFLFFLFYHKQLFNYLFIFYMF